MDLVKRIKEIERLEKELHDRYDISIINYPNDDTVVVVNDFNVFMNVVKDSGFLVFDKPYLSKPSSYRARTILDNIVFDFYLEERV